jgi:hypothetical protein
MITPEPIACAAVGRSDHLRIFRRPLMISLACFCFMLPRIPASKLNMQCSAGHQSPVECLASRSFRAVQNRGLSDRDRRRGAWTPHADAIRFFLVTTSRCHGKSRSSWTFLNSRAGSVFEADKKQKAPCTCTTRRHAVKGTE